MRKAKKGSPTISLVVVVRHVQRCQHPNTAHGSNNGMGLLRRAALRFFLPFCAQTPPLLTSFGDFMNRWREDGREEGEAGGPRDGHVGKCLWNGHKPGSGNSAI